MDRQALIDRLLDHYDQPRNHGAMADADVQIHGGNPDCGDEVTIYLKIDAASGRVARISFEGRGCTISQAAASLLSELFAGAELGAISSYDEQALIDYLGREVVQARPRCATLALGTLKTAVLRYRQTAGS